jgi:hypothetical protein
VVRALPPVGAAADAQADVDLLHADAALKQQQLPRCAPPPVARHGRYGGRGARPPMLPEAGRAQQHSVHIFDPCLYLLLLIVVVLAPPFHACGSQ